MLTKIAQPPFDATVAAEWIKEYLFSTARGTTGSMQPTILPGDLFFVNHLIYRIKKPQHGDIIAFRHPTAPSRKFMKRLIGIEGDVIEIKAKQLFINGVEQSESYKVHQNGEDLTSIDDFGPVTVPSGSFFFLGDNRDVSSDGRHWGFATKKNIIGKVTSIYWSWNIESKSIRWNRIGKYF